LTWNDSAIWPRLGAFVVKNCHHEFENMHRSLDRKTGRETKKERKNKLVTRFRVLGSKTVPLKSNGNGPVRGVFLPKLYR
jgi:hypothetical protein